MTRAAALALAASVLTGCIATQRDVLGLNEQSDEIKYQVKDLKKSLSSMQANQAELAVKMDQVRGDLSAFTENLKDSQDRMARLSSKMDDLEAALGQKVTALGDTLTRQQQAQLASQHAALQAAEQAQRTAEDAAQRAAQQAAQQAAAQAQAAAGPTPSQIYHSAQMNLGKKRFDLAAQGFDLYLKKYPKGEVADLAAFYLGEAYYGSAQWESAARQYAVLLDRYPKSDMTPSARLKYAMSLMNLKTKTHLPEAKRYLQSIQDDFPKSTESAAAGKLLRKLEAAPAPRAGRR